MTKDSQNSSTQTGSPPNKINDEESIALIDELLSLQRYRKALQVALKMNNKDIIRKVGEAAMNGLSMEIASEAFAACGDGAMHNITESISNEEEYNYLIGYKLMIDKDFGNAQKSF